MRPLTVIFFLLCGLSLAGDAHDDSIPEVDEVAQALNPLLDGFLASPSQWELARKRLRGFYDVSPVLKECDSAEAALSRFPMHRFIAQVVEQQLQDRGIRWNEAALATRHRIIEYALALECSRTDGLLMLQLQRMGGAQSGPALRALRKLESAVTNATNPSLQIAEEEILQDLGKGAFVSISKGVARYHSYYKLREQQFSWPGNVDPLPITINRRKDGTLVIVARTFSGPFTTERHGGAFLSGREAEEWTPMNTPLYAYTSGALLPDDRVVLGEQGGRVLWEDQPDKWIETQPFTSSGVALLITSGPNLYAISDQGDISVAQVLQDAVPSWRLIRAGNPEVVAAVPRGDRRSIIAVDQSGLIFECGPQAVSDINRHNADLTAEPKKLVPLTTFLWDDSPFVVFALGQAELVIYQVGKREATVWSKVAVRFKPGELGIVPYSTTKLVVFCGLDDQIVLNSSGDVVQRLSLHDLFFPLWLQGQEFLEVPSLRESRESATAPAKHPKSQ